MIKSFNSGLFSLVYFAILCDSNGSESHKGATFMEVTKINIKGVSVIAIHGDLNFNNFQIVKKTLSDFIDEVKNSNKSTGLVLDLKDVSFMDSTGVGYLCGKHLGLKKLEKQLVLCRIDHKVQQIFSNIKLDEVFEIYQDVLDVVEALKSPDFDQALVQIKQI